MVDLRNNHGLLTKWAEDVEPSKMWDVYPRPQLTRVKWQNLNGHWSYCITEKNNKLPLTHFEEAGLILVPFAVESVLSGVQKPLLPKQTLWSKRESNPFHPQAYFIQPCLVSGKRYG